MMTKTDSEKAVPNSLSALLEAWTVDTPDISAPLMAALDAEDNAALLTEMRALRAEVRGLREELAALRRPPGTRSPLTSSEIAAARIPRREKQEKDVWSCSRF